ncbi:peptidase domain-containing protein [Methanolobus profundi]|uniref:Peptidase C-terminal archaeal/bacterial domain-containing protein n=1 Tax=Methanolobus profundi TaxID=487685 RepID=A0A1I4P0U3_9EURY|nr:peptidase domain-containing protein [Methanolobus profundi]SFM21454.1 hypothetical protein SAMN04488696_0392 [Methanolobus profundi]
MIKKIGIVLLFLLFSAGCAVAEENLASDELSAQGYIVTPSKNDNDPFPILKTSDTITQGETNWHYKSVSSYITTLDVNLNWGNTGNSLRLTIYTPDGVTLGPYYDSADGSIDGKIDLDITNSNGIATGTWNYKVYGYSVYGTESYTI